jgi:thiosulfate/3-mercaptopyruvate sulfurtransferase
MLARPQDIAPDWVILDVGTRARYLQAHIPGARWVDYTDLVAPQGAAVGACPPPEAVLDLYHRWGISPTDTVLVYDDAFGCSAGRAFWTLDLCQHKDIRYLNGGFRGWLAADLPLEQSLPTYPPTMDPISFDPTPLVDYAQMQACMRDPDSVIWDTRSPEEYAGTETRAALAGHIPGARNYPWSNALAGTELRDFNLIRAELSACGIHADKQIITHCHSHHRSAFCYMLGRLLGFPRIRAYAGSWSEWGNHPDSPVVRGTQP